MYLRLLHNTPLKDAAASMLPQKIELLSMDMAAKGTVISGSTKKSQYIGSIDYKQSYHIKGYQKIIQDLKTS